VDYRCPICTRDLAKRKLSQSVVARWEIDCRFCGKRIRLNVHPLELKVVMFGFAAFVVLAVFAWRLESKTLTVLALCAGIAGPLALPVLERTTLRTWARYAPIAPGPDR
jgi:DNA-directed RNA polymerase subunit RPC12/RpoP